MEKRVQPKYLPRLLTVEEYEQLEHHMSLKHKIFFGMMFYCGLRHDETNTLEKDQIHLHSERVFVMSSKGRHRQPIVPIPYSFIHTLKYYFELFTPVKYALERSVGTAYSKYYRANYSEYLKKYAYKAGLPNWQALTPHCLRHSYATLLLEAGLSIEYISALLGHATVETTRDYYIHLSFQTKKNAVEDVFNKRLQHIFLRRNKFI